MASTSRFSGVEKTKKKKNAFFFFMVDRKKDLERNGMKFPRGYRDVAEYVSKEWEEMTQPDRDRFVSISQQYNDGLRAADSNGGSGNSSGVNIANDLRFRIKDNKMKKGDARNHVLRILRKGDPKEMPIVLLNFSEYCELTNGNGTLAIPAEVGLAVFSMKDGVYDNFSALIDPGEFEEDDFYRYKILPDIKQNAKLKSLPEPGYSLEFQNRRKMLDAIEEFVSTHSRSYFGEPYLFCLDSESSVARACLNWLFQTAADIRDFKILSLNFLMQLMSREAHFKKEVGASGLGIRYVTDAASVGIDQEELSSAIAKKMETVRNYVAYPDDIPWIRKGVFMLENDVEEFLFRRNYAYYGELACLYHMELDDGVHHCTQNKVNRYAYGLLDVMMPNFDVIPLPGKHYPTMDDLEQEGIRRRDMLNKSAIGDFSFVAYQQFLKNEDNRSLLDELESREISSGVKLSKAEKKRQNQKKSVGDSSGRIVKRGNETSDEFELL